MDPEPLIKAIVDLARAQLKLGTVITKSLLNLQGDTLPPSEEPTDDEVERAAASIQRDILRHKDVGFASLIRVNFPPEELRKLARAALKAAYDR